MVSAALTHILPLAVTLAGLWLFYVAFAASVGVYRAWVKGKLNMLNKVLFAPVLIAFGAVDVALNFSVMMLLGLPPLRCMTISDRLQVYHTGRNLWDESPYPASPFQKAFATFVCERLLNPIDPSGQHC